MPDQLLTSHFKLGWRPHVSDHYCGARRALQQLVHFVRPHSGRVLRVDALDYIALPEHARGAPGPSGWRAGATVSSALPSRTGQDESVGGGARPERLVITMHGSLFTTALPRVAPAAWRARDEDEQCRDGRGEARPQDGAAKRHGGAAQLTRAYTNHKHEHGMERCASPMPAIIAGMAPSACAAAPPSAAKSCRLFAVY